MPSRDWPSLPGSPMAASTLRTLMSPMLTFSSSIGATRVTPLAVLTRCVSSCARGRRPARGILVREHDQGSAGIDQDLDRSPIDFGLRPIVAEGTGLQLHDPADGRPQRKRALAPRRPVRW